MYKLYNIRGVTMKLKTKIQLAFCVLSIVPLILVVGVLSVGTYKLKTIYNTYKIDMNTYTVMFNPMLAFNAVNSSIEDELEVVRDANPDLLCDPEYLDEYFNGLTNDATDIIVILTDSMYIQATMIIRRLSFTLSLPRWKSLEDLTVFRVACTLAEAFRCL